MIRSKYSTMSLRMLFSVMLMVFMFSIWTNAAQNISSLFDGEAEMYELAQEPDAEPKEENKKNKQEKELDDFHYLTFSHAFISANSSSPEADHSLNWSNQSTAVRTPPPKV